MVEALANKLTEMHNIGVRHKEVTVQVNLFGIMYAEEIRACDASLNEIVVLSGIREGHGNNPNLYLGRISDGMKLARYVKPRRKEKLLG